MRIIERTIIQVPLRHIANLRPAGVFPESMVYTHDDLGIPNDVVILEMYEDRRTRCLAVVVEPLWPETPNPEEIIHAREQLYLPLPRRND